VASIGQFSGQTRRSTPGIAAAFLRRHTSASCFLLMRAKATDSIVDGPPMAKRECRGNGELIR
jgi:hypothetical protein